MTHNLDEIAESYTELLKKHGISPKSVGYKDTAAQELRYRKLCEVFEPNERGPLSINELGCGFGAFHDYLVKNRCIDIRLYRGYDISAEMLEAARNHLPQHGVELKQGAKLEKPTDYSFISGIFNVKLDASQEEWGGFVRETLLNVAAMSDRGLAFYLMSSWVDWKEDRFYYADPMEYFNFCKRNISPYVVLLHDYPLYEWTIIVRKSGAAP